MRRLIYILLSIVVLFTACENEGDSLTKQDTGKIIKIELLSDVNTLPQTKVSYTPSDDKSKFAFSWHEGDEISLFVSSTSGNDNQKFVAQTTGKSSALNGQIATWLGEKDVCAIYPYRTDGYIVDGAAVIIDQSVQNLDISETNRYTNSLLVASVAGATAVSEDNYSIPKLSFQQVMSFLYLELVNIPDGETIIEMGVEAESDLFYKSTKVNLTNGVLEGSKTKVNKLSATVINHSGTKATLSFALLPVDLKGKDFSIYVTTMKDSDLKIYKRKISTGVNFEQNKFSYSSKSLDLQADFTIEGTNKKILLTDFDGTFVPSGDSWVIEDETATTTSFIQLKNTLKSLSSDRSIALIFPNLKAVPNAAIGGNDEENDVNTSLTSISCPLATVIGESAFQYCKALTNVDFPKAVTIGATSFRCCEILTNISFPMVKIIERYAFHHCTSLNPISFPVATSIDDGAFSGCEALESIYFPKVTTIGDNAFSHNYYSSFNSSLKEVSFPVATTIGSYAFSGCETLTSLSFPLVSMIGKDAFANCKTLKIIEFPQLTTIEGSGNQGAFGSCDALTTVKMPIVTSIGSRAFQYCKSLKTINAPIVEKIEWQVFVDCKDLTEVSFPIATSIGSNAFLGCISLSTVSFPALTLLDNGVFYSCDALSTLSIATSEGAVLATMGKDVFKLTETTSHEENVTLNIGNANVAKISGNTLTVSSNSYTFKNVNLIGGNNCNTEAEGNDANGEGF